MNIQELINRIDEKKRFASAIYSDIKEVSKGLEENNSDSKSYSEMTAIILPIAYRHIGARLFHWDRDGPVNTIELSYLEVGKWLSTHYPPSLQHYFINTSEEAQKRVDDALDAARKQRPCA